MAHSPDSDQVSGSAVRRFTKKLISVAAYHLSFWQLVYAIVRVVRKRRILAVFTFHRVTESHSTGGLYLEYDRGLDQAVFRLHVEAIGKYFNVVSLSEFLDIVSGQREPLGHCALITFDDADGEFISNALPVLKESGSPGASRRRSGRVANLWKYWMRARSGICAEGFCANWAAWVTRRSTMWSLSWRGRLERGIVSAFIV